MMIDMTTPAKVEQALGNMERVISELSALSSVSTKALLNELIHRINAESFAALHDDFMKLYFMITTEEQNATEGKEHD